MGKDKQNNEEKSVAPVTATGSLFSFNDLDHFFDDFFLRKWPRTFDGNHPVGFEKGFLKVDILDHDKDIEVQAALPGVSKEDLEVSIDNQLITIRSCVKSEKKEEGKYFRREISRGEYQRTLLLPENVDGDNAKASFKDGILKVMIPKSGNGKRKTIEIK